MTDILKDILNELPKCIADASFEGANIVLYTKDREFFKNSDKNIRDIVKRIKKRIELRAYKDILMDTEKAEKEIKNIVPEDAEIFLE